MRNWSFPLARVAGIPIDVHVTFVALAGLVAAGGLATGGIPGLGWSLLLFIGVFSSTVLHELGHCLAASRYGIRTQSILLLPVGGVARLDSIPREPHREILITLAGPAVNFLIVLTLLPFTGFDPAWWLAATPLGPVDVLQSLVAVNLAMGLFNFLPIFPMDGGRILRAVLSLQLNYLSATRVAAHGGKVLAAVAIVASLWHVQQVGILPVVLFALVFLGGDLEYRELKRQEQVAGLQVGALLRRRFLRLDADATITAALDLITWNRPQDILLVDGNRPVASLNLEALRSAATSRRHSDPARAHAVAPLMILQADWPLSFADAAIRRSPQKLFPVYQHGELVGVIDGRSYAESLEWIRLVRQVQGTDGLPG